MKAWKNFGFHRMLSWLPASSAHDLAPLLFKCLSVYHRSYQREWSPLKWQDLYFPNPLGIAGGVDKNAFNVTDWWKFGVGFIEVGTVTPKPQSPNPLPYIMRDVQSQTLWNKLGFPNKGSEMVKKRLLKLKRPYLTPLFLNIGKNRDTPEDKAFQDYIHLVQTFEGLVDGFVINISSPNTKGLRQLLSSDKLKAFLSPIVDTAKNMTTCRLFLKLSPDMAEADFFHAIDLGLKMGLSGFVLTNTTLDRPEGSLYPPEGGLSGTFLRDKSLKMLKLADQFCKDRRERKGRILISVGGVMTAKDVIERLECGADLVQVYTALVFEGPLFFHKVAQKIAQNP